MTPTDFAQAEARRSGGLADLNAVEVKDRAQAIEWYRKAAAQGDAEAQSKLATFGATKATQAAKDVASPNAQAGGKTVPLLPGPAAKPNSDTNPDSSDEEFRRLTELAFRQARSCIRSNNAAAYQSGAYGLDQMTSFLKSKCHSAFYETLKQADAQTVAADLPEPSFELLVLQEVFPQQYGDYMRKLERTLAR